MSTLSNVETRRGEANPSSIRLAPDAYPEAKSSKTGESVRYVPDPNKHWYVFRASRGREDKAFDFMVEDGTFCYIGKRYERKIIRGKERKILRALIPNLVFAFTTEEQAEQYVKRTPSLSYLTYYYNHFEIDDLDGSKNPPLIVPIREMEKFIITTNKHNEHLRFIEESQCHYKSGDIVRVVDGEFKGVEGRVARVAGQQRVVISLANIGLISTAYIPKAFIRVVE